jgi:hypothetical protein
MLLVVIVALAASRCPSFLYPRPRRIRWRGSLCASFHTDAMIPGPAAALLAVLLAPGMRAA